MSDSLQPHALQHANLPCPSPTPEAYLNSCPSSRWCHPTISSSVVPFSSWLQSFPASGSFPMSEFFAWGGQSIGLSASASVLPMNIQDWFPLELIGSIFLQSQESQGSSPTPQFKSISSSALNFLDLKTCGYQHFQLFKDIWFPGVQWLAFCTFTAKGLGSTPCWGTKIFLYSPTVTSIHDYWKNHSFD